MKKSLLAAAAGMFLFSLETQVRALEVSFEKDTALPIASVNVALKTGSVSDPEGQAGMTNFMGEMMLRGTKSRSKADIDRILDQIGARLEVETRSEALIFRGSVLSSKLDEFLSLLAEIVREPSFAQNELKKLKSEVVSGLLEELGSDNSLATKKFNEFLFENHPYGKPVLGKIKDVEKFTPSLVQKHYDRLVRGNAMLVVGMGDADESKVRAWAESLAAARSGKAGVVEVETPPNPEKRRVLIVDKPERTQTQIFVGHRGVRMTHDDFFPLFLANHVFGGGSFSSRLMSEVRVKRGWSYGAYSYFRHGTEPRSWQMHLFPAAKDTPQALATVLQMYEEFRNRGMSEEEYVFARDSLVNSAGFMYNTAKKRVENLLLEKTLGLPEGFMESYAGNLKSVSRDEANEATKKFFQPSALAITIVGTAKALKDPVAKAAGVSASEIRVVPYTQE